MHICLYMCTCMVRYCWRLEDPVRAGGIHELPNMGFELQGSWLSSGSCQSLSSLISSASLVVKQDARWPLVFSPSRSSFAGLSSPFSSPWVPLWKALLLKLKSTETQNSSSLSKFNPSMPSPCLHWCSPVQNQILISLQRNVCWQSRWQRSHCFQCLVAFSKAHFFFNPNDRVWGSELWKQGE